MILRQRSLSSIRRRNTTTTTTYRSASTTTTAKTAKPTIMILMMILLFVGTVQSFSGIQIQSPVSRTNHCNHHHHHLCKTILGRQPTKTTNPFLQLSASSSSSSYNNNDEDSDDSDFDKNGGRKQLQQSRPLPILSETSQALRRFSWFSWWAQVILTTVSTVTLGFARNVLRLYNTKNSIGGGSNGGLFVLAGSAVTLSALSILWTWANGWRLTRRLIRPKTSPSKALQLCKRAIRIGVTINLIGLSLSLLGAEQIVGVLAIKVLTNMNQNLPFGGAPSLGGANWVQPLDILIVQANTNLLLSHFVSLASLLLLTRQVDKLEEDILLNADNDHDDDDYDRDFPPPPPRRRNNRS